MAGDWIKMRADLFTHPKVFQIAESLGKDELYVVGALLAFWGWADKHAVDGRVDGATSRLVDRSVRVDGLAEALVLVGWLEVDPAGLVIPRFNEHNSESAKERSLKNQRQARWRDRKAQGAVDDKASTKPSTSPSTREEKRREEKKEQEQAPAIAPADLFPGVSPQVVADFKKLRKAKKAELTATAVAGIQREAEKAGLTLEAALTLCCLRGWAGFKADWVTGQTPAATPTRKRKQLGAGSSTNYGGNP